MEFSKVQGWAACFGLGYAYKLFSYTVIPLMGYLIANDYNAYRYLVDSIRKFPNQVGFGSSRATVR